jgi:hypothetical protein
MKMRSREMGQKTNEMWYTRNRDGEEERGGEGRIQEESEMKEQDDERVKTTGDI